MILFYFSLGSTLLRSTFVFTRLFGAKTISGRSHFEDDSSPHISGSSSLIWIDLMFVLFKHVILMWINYWETWLRSDNTSCYYTGINYRCKSFLSQERGIHPKKFFSDLKMKKWRRKMAEIFHGGNELHHKTFLSRKQFYSIARQWVGHCQSLILLARLGACTI